MEIAEPKGLAMFSVSASGRIVAWDDIMTEATGLRAAEVVGRPCYECVHMRDERTADGLCSPDCGLLGAAQQEQVTLMQRLVCVGKPCKTAVMTVIAAPQAAPDTPWGIVHVLRFPSDVRTLTPTELRVMAHLKAGASTEEIARDLDIRISTARTHVRHILEKLGVKSRVAAVGLLAGEGRGDSTGQG